MAARGRKIGSAPDNRRILRPTSGANPTEKCSLGVPLEIFEVFDTKELAEACLTEAFSTFNFDGLSDGMLVKRPDDDYTTAIYSGGPIEYLANINLNYAILLGEMTSLDYAYLFDSQRPTFTLRATVFTTTEIALIPLPAGTPLLAAGLAVTGFLRKRRSAA